MAGVIGRSCKATAGLDRPGRSQGAPGWPVGYFGDDGQPHGRGPG